MARKPKSSSQQTILLVDGCSLTRESVGLMLRSQYFTVHTAITIACAIEQIKEHKPGIIVHDMDFADGTAKDLMDQVSDCVTDQPILHFILTGTADKGRLLGFIEHGVTQIMLKPEFTPKVFFDKISALSNILCYEGESKNDNIKQVSSPTSKISIAPPRATPSLTNTQPEAYSEPASAHLPKSALLLKDIKPLFTRSEMLKRLEDITEIKALAPTSAQVLSLTQSASTSMDSITKAIRNDHAIALKVIQLANSSAFNRGDPVSSLHDAVLRIGCEQIRQTVVNMDIMDNFSQSNNTHINPLLFWEHSIAVSICCSMIARETEGLTPDNAFTIGLLHDVGRMLLDQVFPEDYSDVIALAKENNFPVELVERRTFLVDHASIMDRVLRQWGIHKDLVEPIVNHHLSVPLIRRNCPSRIESTCALALANRIVHSLGIGCSGNSTIYSTEEFFEALNLSSGLLNTISEKLPEMVLDMRFSMLGNMGAINFPKKTTNDLNGLVPLYATLHPTKDAIGKWVEGFSDEIAHTPPNLIVARVRRGREITKIVQLIEFLESQHHVSNLPVIILSDGGNIDLPEEIRTSRSTEMLATPFTTKKFAELAEQLVPTYVEHAA